MSSFQTTSLEQSREQWLEGESSKRPCTKLSDGEIVARELKKALMALSPTWDPRIPIHRVSAVAFYEEHQDIFDRLAKYFKKNRLDISTYCYFYVNVLNKRDRDIDTTLLTKSSLIGYADFLGTREKDRQIFSWFMKSAENLANEAVEHGFVLTKDVLRYLIKSRKIAQWVVCGKLSVYFLAAIPRFDSAIPRLDFFARAELEKLRQMFDIYSTDVNRAFLTVKCVKLNPFAVTDELIAKKRRERNIVMSSKVNNNHEGN